MTAIVRVPTRVVRSSIKDSARWDGFPARPDDIVIATYPKCGTTWTQRIVDMLVFQSPEPRQFLGASPWLDCVFQAPQEVNLAVLGAQTHRRFIKSHLPFDALPVFEGVKYIHVARDGRDACLSMHNHVLGLTEETRRRGIAIARDAGMEPSRSRFDPPHDPREYFLLWMDEAEGGLGDGGDPPFCEFEQTYWRHRADDNLLMVHYADLKADLAGEIRRISAFLEIDTPEDLLPRLAEAGGFETMKSQGEQMMPQLRTGFDHGSQRFLDKGQNGRWRGVLTDADLARYDALVRTRLSPSHNAWIHGGRRAAGDPRTAAD
jgi:aryl sulfotransferase